MMKMRRSEAIAGQIVRKFWSFWVSVTHTYPESSCRGFLGFSAPRSIFAKPNLSLKPVPAGFLSTLLGPDYSPAMHRKTVPTLQ